MAVAARRRLTGKQREQQLLDVAEDLFAQHGFEGVSMEGIARAAGVSRPIVYQHHGSLESIFVSCVRRARDEFEAALPAATADADMDTVIADGGRVFLELIATNPRRWTLLFTSSASLSGDMAEQLLHLRQRTIDRIAEVAAPHVPDVPRPLVLAGAHVISGVGEQLGRWWLAHPRTGLDEVLAMYVAAVGGAVRGLFALGAAARPDAA